MRGWLEERRRTKEIERDLQARRGKAQIKRHVAKQQGMLKRLWELGKRSLQLGDTARFKQIGMLYLQTQSDITRWERYLLSLEVVEARRDQARAATEFLGSLQAMSQSMLATASPKDMAQTQRDLELGLARAQDLEERLSLIMEMTDETMLTGDLDLSFDEQFRELEQAMTAEASHEEGATFDTQIEAGLLKIAEEMRKDLK